MAKDIFSVDSTVLLPNGKEARIMGKLAAQAGFHNWSVVRNWAVSLIHCYGEPTTDEIVLIGGMDETKPGQPFMCSPNMANDLMRRSNDQ